MEPQSSLPQVDLAGLAALLGSVTATAIVVRGWVRERRREAARPEPVAAIPLDTLAEVVRILRDYDGPERRRGTGSGDTGRRRRATDDPAEAEPDDAGVRGRRGARAGGDGGDARAAAPVRRRPPQRRRADGDPDADS